VARFEMLGKVACAGIRFWSLPHQQFDVLKVLVHPSLAVLLGFSNADHVATVASDFTDDDQFSAVPLVGAAVVASS